MTFCLSFAAGSAAQSAFQQNNLFGNKPLAATNISSFSSVFGSSFTTNGFQAPGKVSPTPPPASPSLPLASPNPVPASANVWPSAAVPEEFPLPSPPADVPNDPVALKFLDTAGVNNESARHDLMLAVADCQAAGLWTNLVDLLAFEPRYQPQALISLFGRPWTFTNAVWNERGAGEFRATNFISFKLPAGLNNYTFCVFYRENAAGLDRYDATAAFNNLAELRSSTDGSCTLLNTWAIWNGSRVWTSQGTNFTFWDNRVNVLSNKINTLLSGSARSDGSAACVTPSLLCVGYSNGIVSVSVNGNPAFLGQNNSITNQLTMLANSSPVDELRIGGGDTNWLNLGCSNLFGATVLNAMVFNCSLSHKLSACAMRMATDLEPFNEAVEFAGSSIINDQQPANGGHIGTPLTNSLGVIDEQQNPGRLVFQSAAPGSFLRDWRNCVATVPATAFTPVLRYLNPAKYTTRHFITDAPRNDAFSGIPVADSVARFDSFCRPLLAEGIRVELLATPWSYANSDPQNINWIDTGRAIKAEFPLSNFYPFADLVSPEVLAAASQDDPPVHPSARNVAGYLFNAAMDDMANGKPVHFSPQQ